MMRWSFPAALALILAGVAAAHWQAPATAPGGTRAAHAAPAPNPDPGAAPAAPRAGTGGDGAR